MKYTTKLVNTDVNTVELLELAIIGLETEILDRKQLIAKLTGELADMRQQEGLGDSSKQTQPKRKPGSGRPGIPAPCPKCGKHCVSKKIAEMHCKPSMWEQRRVEEAAQSKSEGKGKD